VFEAAFTIRNRFNRVFERDFLNDLPSSRVNYDDRGFAHNYEINIIITEVKILNFEAFFHGNLVVFKRPTLKVEMRFDIVQPLLPLLLANRFLLVRQKVRVLKYLLRDVAENTGFTLQQLDCFLDFKLFGDLTLDVLLEQ
jgi:hypothetical protein